MYLIFHVFIFQPNVWKSDQIWLRSFQRNLLMNYIQVAWQSDYMYRFGRV